MLLCGLVIRVYIWGMTTELGYNNDDFIRDRITAVCKEGQKKTYCSFPASHEIINHSLYLRVVVYKLRKASAVLFEKMTDRYIVKINFESIWSFQGELT